MKAPAGMGLAAGRGTGMPASCAAWSMRRVSWAPSSWGTSWPSLQMRTGLPSFRGLNIWWVASKGRSTLRFQSTLKVPPTGAPPSQTPDVCSSSPSI